MPKNRFAGQLLILLLFLGLSCYAQGLQAGAAIPDFRLPDQNGSIQTFQSLRGPRGAMLVFYRSADW
jgi:hypothetical protein